jgi:Uma2 family endonuclease
MVTETPTRRFTVDEFLLMDEAGVFKPNERVELIDGEIIPMQPIGPFHSDTVDELLELFISKSRGRWRVRGQHAVAINEDSLPQPDVTLVKRRRYGKEHPKSDDVYLLVEVAESSLRFDRKRKLPLYAKAAIVEYWIINLKDRTVEVYRDPNFTGYASKTILEFGQFASPAAFPDVKISVAELLAAAE